MANPSKAKGSLYERQIRDYIRSLGGYRVELLRTAGKEDEGDLVVMEGPTWDHLAIGEAKAAARYDLSGWMNEALNERDSYARHRGLESKAIMPFVVIKRRQKPIAESFVLTTAEEFFA